MQHETSESIVQIPSLCVSPGLWLKWDPLSSVIHFKSICTILLIRYGCSLLPQALSEIFTIMSLIQYGVIIAVLAWHWRQTLPLLTLPSGREIKSHMEIWLFCCWYVSGSISSSWAGFRQFCTLVSWCILIALCGMDPLVHSRLLELRIGEAVF